MATRHPSVLNMIKLFRRHLSTLPDCGRTTVCGADCMLRILQLSMAEVNKQICGEFTVCLSDVLTAWKYFLHDKLVLQYDMGEPEHYANIRTAYDVFLKSSNMLDLIDVYQKCAELKWESNIGMLLPAQMLEFILDGSQDSGEQDHILSTISTPNNKRNLDGTKLRLVMTRIVCAYLNLLVNSKNDLALPYVLNVPDRGLGRDAFTDLKHAARTKQMSLFLVATSFVRTIELGGKGYAPSQSDPLRKHVKGLTSFVNFIDKLDEMLCEISDPRTAVGRILSTIKMHLIKGRSSGDPYCGAVLDVVHDLELRIQNIINAQHELVSESITGISPARPKMHAINHGTASGGRDTLKALLVLLDEDGANAPSKNKADLLCGDEENESLFGVDCMLTLFRSPEQANGPSPKSLRQRVQQSMDEKKSKMKQTLIRSQFACTYKDDHAMNRKQQNFPSQSQVPTCVHPAPKLVSVLCFDEALPEDSLAKRPMFGLISGNVPLKGSVCGKGNSNGQSEHKSSKRKQVDLSRENVGYDETEPPHKKTVTGPKMSKKPHKLISKPSATGNGTKSGAKNTLIVGQAKLTSFFRL